MDHVIDEICSCWFCQMIDVMWGDPLLNDWERKFVNSVARFGWIADYSQKQKTVIERIFKTQKRKYTKGTANHG